MLSKKKPYIECFALFILIFHQYCFTEQPSQEGDRVWDIVSNDIEIDISILSKLSHIDNNAQSIISFLDNAVSITESIYNVDQTVLSKIMVIDTRTSAIQSGVNVLYSFDQVINSNVNNIFSIDTVINSKVDVINNIEQTTLSKVMVIDTRTSNIASNVTNIYNLDQSINSMLDIINNTEQTTLSKVMVIDTRTSNIASNVTNIFNIDQSINSKVDYSINLDNTIFSAVAALSSCCTGTTANLVLNSLYSEKISENRFDNLSIQFQYGIPSLTTNSYTQGSATITTANSMAVLNVSSTNSIAQLQSMQTILYRSGHDAYAIFTVAFTGEFTATSSQFIGPIDYQNGFAIGFNGTTFGITMRNNTNNTFISQSQFNGDKLDGIGTSQMIYTPSNINTFRIDYGDIGASVITFRIMNNSGNWITFHTIKYPNSSSTPSILQPFLPITARVETFAGTGASVFTLRTATWNAGTVGTPNAASYRYFQEHHLITVSATNPRHILTIRNKTVFNNKPNVIQARIAFFGGGAAGQGGDSASVNIIKNATVTGTSFSDIETGNSIMQSSTTGTYTASTGQTLLVQPSYPAGTGPIIHMIRKDILNIILYPGETITLTGNTSNGNSTEIYGTIGWEEQF